MDDGLYDHVGGQRRRGSSPSCEHDAKIERHPDRKKERPTECPGTVPHQPRADGLNVDSDSQDTGENAPIAMERRRAAYIGRPEHTISAAAVITSLASTLAMRPKSGLSR